MAFIGLRTSWASPAVSAPAAARRSLRRRGGLDFGEAGGGLFSFAAAQAVHRRERGRGHREGRQHDADQQGTSHRGGGGAFEGSAVEPHPKDGLLTRQRFERDFYFEDGTPPQALKLIAGVPRRWPWLTVPAGLRDQTVRLFSVDEIEHATGTHETRQEILDAQAAGERAGGRGFDTNQDGAAAGSRYGGRDVLVVWMQARSQDQLLGSAGQDVIDLGDQRGVELLARAEFRYTLGVEEGHRVETVVLRQTLELLEGGRSGEPDRGEQTRVVEQLPADDLVQLARR